VDDRRRINLDPFLMDGVFLFENFVYTWFIIK
jgi:hypothetical protein